jgi:hypothetical protein
MIALPRPDYGEGGEVVHATGDFDPKRNELPLCKCRVSGEAENCEARVKPRETLNHSVQPQMNTDTHG